MANKITDTQHYQDIADAIRAKNKSTDTYTPAQMAQAIEDLPSGGMDENFAKLLAGTATGSVTVKGVTDLSMTRISVGLADGMNPITELHLPDLVSWSSGNTNYADRSGGLIDLTNSSTSSATSTFSKLQVLDIPLCKYLYLRNASGVVSQASFGNLVTLVAPSLEHIAGNMIGSKVASIVLPELTSLAGNSFFKECKNLETVSMPKWNGFAPERLFYSCSALREVDLPSVIGISAYMFGYCSALRTVRLPKAVSNGGHSYAFYECTALEIVDMGSSTQNGGTFGNSAFAGCSVLRALVLRNKTVYSLNSTNPFTNTPIASGTGYIYVPRDLISTYESATNWSTYAGQFRAIEDYTADGTVDGEFIMPT